MRQQQVTEPAYALMAVSLAVGVVWLMQPLSTPDWLNLTLPALVVIGALASLLCAIRSGKAKVIRQVCTLWGVGLLVLLAVLVPILWF